MTEGPEPSRTRPRLPDEQEAELRPIDERSAEAYTAIEQGIARIDALLDDGAVVEALGGSDTAVHRITRDLKDPGKPA